MKWVEAAPRAGEWEQTSDIMWRARVGGGHSGVEE